MHELDALCILTVREFAPKEIKRIREKAKVSQPVFAACLNISASAVKKWEIGDSSPQTARLGMTG